MPVHAVAGGYRWGQSGKVYKTRAAAERQGRAVYASGWRDDTRSGRRNRRQLARLLKASSRAETTYIGDLVRIMRGVHRGVTHAILAELPTEQRQDAVKMPEGLEGRIAAHLRQRVGVAFDRMAREVDKKSARAHTLIGITAKGAGIEGAVRTAREANVDLLVKAGRAYADDVREVLEDPDNFDLRHEELAGLLEERAGVSVSRATLIARDQTLKLNAAVAQARHVAAGVTQYTWSTSRDERVRPMHAELEGETFSYDEPPETNEDGDTNNPGEDYQCRCLALPIIPELEETEEEAAE